MKGTLLFCLFLCTFPNKSATVQFIDNAGCFVGVIYGNDNLLFPYDIRELAYKLMFKAANWKTWILYYVDKLDLRVEPYSLQKPNLTLSMGYLRFTNKLQSEDCKVFLLLTTSFQDTVLAIQRSGYGSSENHPFFIPVPSMSEKHSALLQKLNRYFVSKTNKFESFSAPVIFFVPSHQTENISSNIGILCYPCIGSGNSVVHILINDLTQILLVSEAINGNMRKKLIAVETDYHLYNTNCLQFPSPFVNRKTYQMTSTCAHWLTAWSAYGHAINATLFAASNHYIASQLIQTNWLTKISMRMVSSFDRPPFRNMYMFSPIGAKMFVCVSSKSLTTLDSTIKHLIPIDILTFIVISVTLYAIVYKSFGKAFKLFWHFLGISSSVCKCRRKSCWPVVALAGLVALFWQTYVSTDALAIQNLPSGKKLVDMNYKLLASGRWIRSLKKRVGESSWKKYAYKFSENMIYDEDQHLDLKISWNLTTLILLMESKRAFVYNLRYRTLWNKIWNQQVMLYDSVVCQMHPDKNISIVTFRSILLSGVCGKAKKLANRWIEVGLAFTDRVFDRTFTRLFGTGITQVGASPRPMPLSASGVLGTCTIIAFSAEACILIAWLLCHQKLILDYANWKYNILVWYIKAWNKKLKFRLKSLR